MERASLRRIEDEIPRLRNGVAQWARMPKEKDYYNGDITVFLKRVLRLIKNRKEGRFDDVVEDEHWSDLMIEGEHRSELVMLFADHFTGDVEAFVRQSNTMRRFHMLNGLNPVGARKQREKLIAEGMDESAPISVWLGACYDIEMYELLVIYSAMRMPIFDELDSVLPGVLVPTNVTRYHCAIREAVYHTPTWEGATYAFFYIRNNNFLNLLDRIALERDERYVRLMRNAWKKI